MIKKIFKPLLVIALILLLVVQISLSLSKSVQETGKITFIYEKPEVNSLTQKYAYISGAVKKPGVYEIKDGTRVYDLIQMAEGLTDEVDKNFVSETINLANILKDQDKVFIPIANLTNAPQDTDTNLINLNTAELSTLVSLPGIGDSTAKKILQNRPYSEVEDLLKVPGIGTATLEKIRDKVSV